MTEQFWIGDKGLYSTLEVGQGANNSLQRSRLLRDLKQDLEFKTHSLE